MTRKMVAKITSTRPDCLFSKCWHIVVYVPRCNVLFFVCRIYPVKA
uniref:Uncharacterized protein n=1 Tax=Rhizophora mucronata TaxID=61149 RepID=A0A2P2PC41_RHIMU